MKVDEIKIDEKLNVKKIRCPTNFARIMLKLETMEKNQILEVLLDDGKPIINIPNALTEEGYKIISKKKKDSSTWELIIRK